MATYPRTGTTLDSKISSSLSTQIIIKVGTETVGAIQELTISQTRPLTNVKEVGTDGILEILPNSATTYTARISRIVFDGLSLPEAFARGFMNIKSQTVPFDIEIIDTSRGEDSNSTITQLVNCWFKGLSTPYRSDGYIITQSADIDFEDIASTLGSSKSNAAVGGDRHINYQDNDRERTTDVGTYRGSMDVANLVKQAFK